MNRTIEVPQDMWKVREYQNGPFKDLLSLAEAAVIWRLDTSTIRKAIASSTLVEGEDCRKFGKQWVVSAKAMCRAYGNYPWNRYMLGQDGP